MQHRIVYRTREVSDINYAYSYQEKYYLCSCGEELFKFHPTTVSKDDLKSAYIKHFLETLGADFETHPIDTVQEP